MVDRDPATLHSSCGQLMRDSYAPRSGAELVWLMSDNAVGHFMKILALFFTLVLVGCTPHTRFYGMPVMSEEKRIEYWREKCVSYGIKVDTPEMAECIKEHAIAAGY